MNKRGHSLQYNEKQRKDNLTFSPYNFWNRRKRCVIIALILLSLTLISISVVYLTSISNEEYIEEVKGESKKSIELNRIGGNFTTRHTLRMKLEEDIKQSLLASSRISMYKEDPDRPLVLYAYSETPSSRANALFFLKNGLHASADFIFILNGETDFELLLPEGVPNIKFIKRDNTCYDLGAYGEVLRNNNKELARKYKRFILLNSSIRGPFQPVWSKGCWSKLYLDRLSDKVKLVGMSYSCIVTRHVQSMIIATDNIGIDILLGGDPTDTSNTPDILHAQEYGNPDSLLGLSTCYTTRYRAVSAEISLTNLIYKAGYNVSVLMTAASTSPSFYEHCTIPEGWEFLDVHPYESLFVKANRDIYMDPSIIKKLTNIHYKLNYSSWEVC
jgi:hypothetical protein